MPAASVKNVKNVKNSGKPKNIKNNKNIKNIRNYEKSKNQIKVRKAGAGIKNLWLAVFVIAVVFAVFLFFANKYFFKIKNINIGENDKYSYDDINRILESNGVFAGEELYGIDVKKIKSDIKDSLTYVENVSISRIPPSTININVKTEEGFFGINIGGDYYIISQKFRVIDKIKVVDAVISESEFEPPGGIITLMTDSVKKCYLGEKIEFSDDDIYDFLKDIVIFFNETNENKDDESYKGNMLTAINNIDITNKFKVVMNYSDKFLVKFGIFENISSKILNSFEIINKLPEHAEGIIDLTEGKTASFKYDSNVAKLYKSGKNNYN